jgi:peroxiredoxin
VQLHRARSDFEAAGVALVLIGQATPRHAANFRRTQRIELPMLADEHRASYKAAGAKIASAAELVGPKSVTAGLARTVRSRGRVHQGRVIGHVAQLGGAILVTPDGRVAWSHMSEDASDTPPPEEILTAASQASTRS